MTCFAGECIDPFVFLKRLHRILGSWTKTLASSGESTVISQFEAAALLYQCSVFPIEIPPLGERREDTPPGPFLCVTVVPHNAETYSVNPETSHGGINRFRMADGLCNLDVAADYPTSDAKSTVYSVEDLTEEQVTLV
jgi:hypothetical protein